MNRDGDKGKVFLNRMLWLAVIELVLVLVILARLYYLQVFLADKYIMLAESNRISMRIIAPPRGTIFDRNKVPLAVNNPNYRVMLVSEHTEGRLQETLQDLGKIISLSEDDYAYIQKEVKRRRSFVPVNVAENLSWEQMANIQVNAPDLPGVMIDKGLTRSYTHPWDTAHILGYLALVDEKDRTGDPLLELSGFKKGKTGLEEFYDYDLRGVAGSRQVEVNVVGREVRELSLNKGVPGRELDLTIDIRLQEFVRKALAKQSGAVVVVDVNTGEIMALVSAPSFDANIFNRGILSKEWKALSENKYKPMVNKAIAGEYSPGSTFKMIVALAALEAGIIDANTEIDCEGYMDIGNHRFHCWKHSGHGRINLKRALAESCDVYFYEIARRVGIDKITEMARKFGLGVKEGIDLPSEKSGLMPTQTWKQRMFNEPWQQGETLLAGIGQSYVLVTPLQLAMMTARIANGGKFVEPHLVKNPYRPLPKDIDINKHYLDLVKEGMRATVNEYYGTAYASKLWDGLGGMSGKTGTTQVKRITREERESPEFTQREVPWHERNHALFVGYAPIKNPKYAIAVLVEHGGGGAAVAAPIAKDILEYALTMDMPKDEEEEVMAAKEGKADE